MWHSVLSDATFEVPFDMVLKGASLAAPIQKSEGSEERYAVPIMGIMKPSG